MLLHGFHYGALFLTWYQDSNRPPGAFVDQVKYHELLVKETVDLHRFIETRGQS